MNRVLSLVRAVPPEPDAALLDRFRAARDDAAFAELVRRYGPLVERPTAVYVTPTMAVGHLTFRRARVIPALPQPGELDLTKYAPKK